MLTTNRGLCEEQTETDMRKPSLITMRQFASIRSLQEPTVTVAMRMRHLVDYNLPLLTTAKLFVLIRDKLQLTSTEDWQEAILRRLEQARTGYTTCVALQRRNWVTDKLEAAIARVFNNWDFLRIAISRSL